MNKMKINRIGLYLFYSSEETLNKSHLSLSFSTSLAIYDNSRGVHSKYIKDNNKMNAKKNLIF